MGSEQPTDAILKRPGPPASLAVTRLPSAGFWKNKRVLLTGHTGFKGSWLELWLSDLGADVRGVGLEPATNPNLYRALRPAAAPENEFRDIRDPDDLAELVRAFDPEIVLHLAAQSLVRPSYADPLATFATNVQGTANLLDAVRRAPSAQAVVVVTTDKVYRNREQKRPYCEDDELGGHDPYSASKAATELVVDSYRRSFFNCSGPGIATVRAGNVIAGGDWARDRLLPDAMRAWNGGGSLQVRRPESTRPWQHVLEPICAYLVLAERLTDEPGISSAYNIGPVPDSAVSVRQVVELAAECWSACDREHTSGADAPDVLWGQSADGPHEAGYLSLDPTRSARVLGVHPVWTVAEAVQKTVSWYHSFSRGVPARDLCRRDISGFLQSADIEGRSQP